MTNEELYKIKNIHHFLGKLYILHEDEWYMANFYDRHVIVKDRCHSKAIQRKYKTKNVRIGDVVYGQVEWSHITIFKNKLTQNARGTVIERDRVIVFYNMPSPVLLSNRQVLIEKYKPKS